MSAGYHTEAWLMCDGEAVIRSYCSADVVGFGTLEEVRAEAHAAGWLIERGMDLCPQCRVPIDRQRDPALDSMYRSMEATDRLEQTQRRTAIKAVSCPFCGAAPGAPCRTSGGNRFAGWHRLRCAEAGVSQ